MNKALFLAGLFLLMGTAGASDLGTISVQQIIIQALVSFGLMGAGMYWRRSHD